MAAKNLVIDTSVASAATERITLDRTSKNCCDFLKEVLACDHRFVMTPSIKTEWDQHQSAFSRKWRLAMIARKRVTLINVEANERLREEFDAIASDKIVISRDEKARIPFTKAAISIYALRDIAWINPDKAEETPIEWLRSGANAEPERLLGSRRKL